MYGLKKEKLGFNLFPYPLNTSKNLYLCYLCYLRFQVIYVFRGVASDLSLYIPIFNPYTNRGSHQKCSVKKGVFRNFDKFTEKHLCQSFFFNKVAGLRPETLLKKRLWHRCFPVNFEKFLRTTFLQNNSGRMLLYEYTDQDLCIFYAFVNMLVHIFKSVRFNTCDLQLVLLVRDFWRCFAAYCLKAFSVCSRSLRS